MASSSTTTSSRRAVSAASLSVPAVSAADATPRSTPLPQWDATGSSAADLLAGAPDDARRGHEDEDGEDDDDEDYEHRIIQTDPSGRFQCWDICLGRGAYKEVYKAFDVEEGVEVAWNQLRADYLSRRDIHKVCGEVKLLKLLHHDNIINFFHVWVARGPDGRERVYFITELMTSGTLKSFVRKTKGKLKPKVVKNLCRHILRGLAYLHSRQPPIIHRDLKSDNIFINGNNGIAKIGDLGLATIKNKDHISSVLGTPEFMAPELYDERYDERVDIYAFGMCVLELVTKEYPYQECHNQAQIYKRVSAGIKPLALNKVTDPDTREFIELCIQHDYRLRPSAAELLEHPFLAADPNGSTVGTSMGLAGSAGGLALPTAVLGAGAGGGGGGYSSSSSAPSTAPSTAPSSYANLDDAVAAARAAVSDPTLAAGAPPLARAPSVAASLERTSTTDSVVSSPAAARGPPTAAAAPPVTLQASGPGYDVTMALISVDAAKFTANLRMTLVIGSSGAPNDVKFPFHLVDDTPALVVAEMIREGVMADVAAAARVQVESLIRHCVFGDEVAAVVLARVNRADAEDVDADMLEAWMDVMQRERAMLDDESERGSDGDEDRELGDEGEDEDDGEGSDAGFGVASPTRAPAVPPPPVPPMLASRILAPLADESPEPPAAAITVLPAAAPEPVAPPPPPGPVAASPPPSPAATQPSAPPPSEPVAPPAPPPAVDTSSALHRTRSLDVDRACLGEGAYVSAFRRAGPASTTTPLASPATSTPITATLGSATTPLAASRPTTAHASQENLRRTLSELQSLALSGFDMDGKRIGGAGAPTTVGMAAAAAAVASKQSSPMLVPGMGVTGGAVPLMTQLPAAAAPASAATMYASPTTAVHSSVMTPRDVMHAPVPLVAAAPHRPATWLPDTYPAYASPTVGLSRAGTPNSAAHGGAGLVMSPTSVPHGHGSTGGAAWPR
ncbi:WNK protein kinase [Allomyces macrogynus ATCC 38327]|uniref:WNK protein kinase n=1 Tax=Allomyces macrogynus (strain ATCC 38327) TaxID=578462 RepID=A0A0L0T4A0_ALLM3|nr:WNK protein kinase [Allomyces macrogynus ATCC 38327]|eukprot:KNE69394.1 WNK protein kinase [Allomyces macrogynus ATCC 38327]